MKNISVGKIITFGLFMMVSSSIWACVDNALDNEANFENCKQQALTGDADAYFQLGKFFSQGRVVAQDYNRALENFQTAAEKGSPEAPYFLRISICLARVLRRIIVKCMGGVILRVLMVTRLVICLEIRSPRK